MSIEFQNYINAHYTRKTIDIIKKYICDTEYYEARYTEVLLFEAFDLRTDDFDPRQLFSTTDLDTYEKRKKCLFDFGDSQEIRRVGSTYVRLHYLFGVAMFEDILRTINSTIIIQRKYRAYSKSKKTTICFVVKELYSVITEKEIIKNIIDLTKKNKKNNTIDYWVTVMEN